MDKWLRALAGSQSPPHPMDPSRGNLLSRLTPNMSKFQVSTIVDGSAAVDATPTTYVGSMLWMLGRCAA
jgi:hypothetical protein